jgi:hypothetical protein
MPTMVGDHPLRGHGSELDTSPEPQAPRAPALAGQSLARFGVRAGALLSSTAARSEPRDLAEVRAVGETRAPVRGPTPAGG